MGNSCTTVKSVEEFAFPAPGDAAQLKHAPPTAPHRSKALEKLRRKVPHDEFGLYQRACRGEHHPSGPVAARFPQVQAAVQEAAITYPLLEEVGAVHRRLGLAQENFESYEDVIAQAQQTPYCWRDPNPPALRDSHVEWQDSSETHPAATFMARSPTDVQRGALADEWFVSAIRILMKSPKLLQRVCTRMDDQLGVYEFTFYKQAGPVKVCVDRMVPVLTNSSPPTLAYCRSLSPHEMWPTLLEKAYAKLHGGYGAIEGGLCCFGLAELTGGVPTLVVPSSLMIHENPNAAELFAVLESYAALGWPIGITFRQNSKGLIAGTTYSVSSLKRHAGHCIVRLRSPEHRTIFKGKFKESGSVWQKYPDLLRDCQPMAEGEFWMEITELTSKVGTIATCEVDGLSAKYVSNSPKAAHYDTTAVDGSGFQWIGKDEQSPTVDMGSYSACQALEMKMEQPEETPYILEKGFHFDGHEGSATYQREIPLYVHLHPGHWEQEQASEMHQTSSYYVPYNQYA